MLNEFKPIPFWSWNEELNKEKLIEQIDWMNDNDIGGFFMHARGGLKTEYLSKEWFDAINVCLDETTKLGMEAYAYDENGWPSGFGGGELLKKEENLYRYLEFSYGPYDKNALVSYDYSGETLLRVNAGENCLNVYVKLNTGWVDLLNEKVVKQHIEHSYEKYRIADKSKRLKGFFTDEPQYLDETYPFSIALPPYFKKQYDEDILDKLGLLFVKKEGYKEFRYRYWKSCNDLFVSNYGKQIHDWCKENGYKLTGHYTEEAVLWLQVGCCGSIMPFYKYMDIPGCDFLGRVVWQTGSAPKQVASVAAQYEKEQVLCEAFALSGWDTTPEELKLIADYHFINGVNTICHHLLPYMEYGQRKRDYPIHFTKSNSWIEKNFKEFNEYLGFMGEKLRNSKEIVNVGVLYPIRSCYFEFDPHNHINSVAELDKAMDETCTKLNRNHIQYHFLDEKLIEEDGFVKGSKIGINKYSYEYLILPLIYTVSKTTEKLLREFVKNGGKVLLLYGKPEYIEGSKANFDYLESNVTFNQIIASQNFLMDYHEDVLVSFRKEKETGRKFFYILNKSDNTEVILNNRKIYLNKYEAKIIYEDELKDEEIIHKNIVHLSPKFKLSKPATNYLCIDNLCFSKDGINFSKEMYHIGAQNMLINERFDGDIYLKYCFETRCVPNNLSILIEKCDLKETRVNGILINEYNKIYDGNLLKAKVSDLIKLGHNEVVLKMKFRESQETYNILFNKDVGGAVRNKLGYESTIEPIYLEGDFGVYGDFKEGKEPNCYLGENFYLDKQKKEISNLITDGFAFLRGSIEIEQDVEINENNTVLEINQRFSLIEVYVNDKYAGKMMFNHKLDISKFTKQGKNKIKLVVYQSNRNLLGPHHVVRAEEEKACGTESFEMPGTWENGESSNFRKNYSFVRNVI